MVVLVVVAIPELVNGIVVRTVVDLICVVEVTVFVVGMTWDVVGITWDVVGGGTGGVGVGGVGEGHPGQSSGPLHSVIQSVEHKPPVPSTG